MAEVLTPKPTHFGADLESYQRRFAAAQVEVVMRKLISSLSAMTEEANRRLAECAGIETVVVEKEYRPFCHLGEGEPLELIGLEPDIGPLIYWKLYGDEKL